MQHAGRPAWLKHRLRRAASSQPAALCLASGAMTIAREQKKNGCARCCIWEWVHAKPLPACRLPAGWHHAGTMQEWRPQAADPTSGVPFSRVK